MLAQPFVDVINLEVSLMTAQQGRNFFSAMRMGLE
jgi:hypothetical protein